MYPHELCQAIASAICLHMKFKPARPLDVVRARGSNQQPKRIRDERAAAGIQARGGRVRRLLPEHSHVLEATCKVSPGDARCSIGHEWPAGLFAGVQIPPLAKTLAVRFTEAAEQAPSSDGASCLEQGKAKQLVSPVRAAFGSLAALLITTSISAARPEGRATACSRGRLGQIPTS